AALALSLRGPSRWALYLQLARRSYRRMATYRTATFAGAFTNTVFGFLRAYVLLAMFRTRSNIGSFDVADTLTYTFLTQALLAAAASFAWRFLVTLSGFWLIDARGATQLGTILLIFLSGFMVPLNFFPAGAMHVVRALPFSCIVQLPVEVFLGKHASVLAFAGVVADQVLWMVILALIGRHVARRAFRKVVVQGG